MSPETANWKHELARAIQAPEELAAHIQLTPDELACFEDQGERSPGKGLPLRITPHYLRLIQRDADGALRRMAIPRSAERTMLSCESPDPLTELPYEVVPRCIHRYRDRVLLLVTDACALYCRHCFRRRFSGKGHGGLTRLQRQAACGYIKAHPEVHEVLLSGGDPLLLDDRVLQGLLGELHDIRPSLVLRLSSRVPVVLPSRITRNLLAIFRNARPFWLAVHINHPAELSDEFVAVARSLSEAGIGLLAQSVLLRGVNDSLPVLRGLFYGLVEAGIKPYYLFQGDLAPGTSHLRVNLKRGLELFRALGNEVSGLALPSFAVDLPGGGGKLRLHPDTDLKEQGGWYRLRGADGGMYRYPDEEEIESI